MTRHRELEPGAPPPAERALNFTLPRERWLSYALIKPFNAATAADADALYDLLTRTRPDGVVVGVRYRRQTEPAKPVVSHEHPYRKNWLADDLPDRAVRFADRIHQSGLVRFASTRCATAWHNRTDHGRVVFEQSPHLCVGCGMCTAGG